MTDVRPASYAILQHFTFEHLPEDLAKISEPFCVLAFDMVEQLPFNAETSTMLRKLLEAKDSAVRSAVEARVPNPLEQVRGHESKEPL